MTSESNREVIRNALHRGFVGGTSGAMAMTIQVILHHRFYLSEAYTQLYGRQRTYNYYFHIPCTIRHSER